MSATTAPQATFAPLRHAAYRRAFAIATFGSIGVFLHMVAAAWLVLELTGSPFWVAATTSALTLPQLLFGIPAGAIADLVDRRKVLVGAYTVSAVTSGLVAALVLADRASLPLLLGATFVLGVCWVSANPAYQSVVNDVLPADQVAAGVSLVAATNNASRAIGPAIGGVLVAAGQAHLAFAIYAAAALVAVVLAATLPTAASAPEHAPLRRAMGAGVRYLRHTPTLRAVLLTSAGFAISAGPLQALIPNVARDELGLQADGFGLLVMAFGGGAVLGALTRTRMQSRLSPDVGLPVAMLLTAGSNVAFALAPTMLAAQAALVIGGMTRVWVFVTLTATVQTMSPAWVRGRALSLHALSLVGMIPIGALVAGSAAEAIGVVRTIIGLAMVTVLVAARAARADLPALIDVQTPVPAEEWFGRSHADHEDGSPVVITSAFDVAPDAFEAFLADIRAVRRVRLQTGATRWLLLRDASLPNRYVEVFEVPDWEEHLLQHRRIDEDMAVALQRLANWLGEGQTTRHHVGVDVDMVDGVPAWITADDHDALHEHDGSLPLRAPGT